MNKFLVEILEQPQALDKTLKYYLGEEGRLLLEKAKNTIDTKQFEQIIFTGMGSSYFTSYAASNLFESLGINSFVVNASELLHYNNTLLKKKTLLICFSQSGESYEVKQLLNELSDSVFCLGITNENRSTLAEKADLTLICKAGKEEMTSTKTYVSTTLVSFILGWYLVGQWNREKENLIRDLISNFKSSLENHYSWVDEMVEFMGELPALQIVARGASFSTACQSGLMFKEANAVPAMGYLGGEFRHGPMEMVKEGFRAILFAAKGKTFTQNVKMAEDIAFYGGKVVLITNEQLQLTHENIHQVYINQKDEYLFSIQSIIPIQLFIDAYAKLRGYEAGTFAHGAKVTMVE